MVKKGIAIFFFSLLLFFSATVISATVDIGQPGQLYPWLTIGGDPQQLNRPLELGEEIRVCKKGINFLVCSLTASGKCVRGWIGGDHPDPRGWVVVVRKRDDHVEWIYYCGNDIGSHAAWIRPSDALASSTVEKLVEKKVFVYKPVVVEKKIFVDRPVIVEREKKIFIDRPVVREKKVFVPIFPPPSDPLAWLLGTGWGTDGSSGVGASIGTTSGGAGGALATAMCGGDKGPWTLALGAGVDRHLGGGFHLSVGAGPYWVLGGHETKGDFGFKGGLVFGWGSSHQEDKTSWNPGFGLSGVFHPNYEPPPPPLAPDIHPDHPDLGSDPEEDPHSDPPPDPDPHPDPPEDPHPDPPDDDPHPPPSSL